jgi:putative acetyltransferase
MIVRPETPGDYEAIDDLPRSAFGQADESKLVRLLRASDDYVPDLTLVAEDDGQVVGHIMFSYVTLKNDEEFRVLSLAPMAVTSILPPLA